MALINALGLGLDVSVKLIGREQFLRCLKFWTHKEVYMLPKMARLIIPLQILKLHL